MLLMLYAAQNSAQVSLTLDSQCVVVCVYQTVILIFHVCDVHGIDSKIVDILTPDRDTVFISNTFV